MRRRPPPYREAPPRHRPCHGRGAGAGKVRVTTDVLVMDIDLRGGTLVYAELPAYPLVKGQAQPVVLLNQAKPRLTTCCRPASPASSRDETRPTHVASFTSAQDRYQLAPGQDELRVPLTWTDGNGVTVAKTFVFRRSHYAIGLEYSVHNTSAAPWAAASYSRISRVDPAVEHSMFKVESFAFRGPAIYDPDGKKYQKLDIEKSEHQNLSVAVKNGWLAGLQHHFVSAIVPDPAAPYTTRCGGRTACTCSARSGRPWSWRPAAPACSRKQLFVGPKLQKQLMTLNPELDHVADYGVLTFLARPMFILLEWMHAWSSNWGLAIIFATSC